MPPAACCGPVPWLHWFMGLELVVIILFIVAAVLVYRDASRRYPAGSLAPLIWFFIAFLLGPIGWILYLLLRPAKPRREA